MARRTVIGEFEDMRFDAILYQHLRNLTTTRAQVPMMGLTVGKDDDSGLARHL